MTSKFCVVGSPIQHSLSPVIHKAAYSLLGLDFSYDKLDVPKGSLSEAIAKKSFSGLSVTMPLKYEAFALSSTCSTEATLTGVVNTLVSSTDGWVGHNTDVSGFERCFQQIPSAGSITILGSGATARSAALAVSRCFASAKVSVVGRTPSSVLDFVELISGFGIEASVLDTHSPSALDADLVVSTVPGSSFTELWTSIESLNRNPRGFLFDVAYDPWPSLASKAWGENSISGLELLIWQGIEQVKLFAGSTGQQVGKNDQELYASMRAAIAEQTGLR